MAQAATGDLLRGRRPLSAALELLKPVTWFPPMWAFACGLISSGISDWSRFPVMLAGVLLTGPLVCGCSQAVNDWFDRDVDALNEPHRPIPSGRIPGRLGLGIAIFWTMLSFIVSIALGPWGVAGATLGLAMAWLYSAPPVRLKRNGWLGNTAVALCYEGLPWFIGVVVISGEPPIARTLTIALLYSLGAHGIMTLNDFKSIRGDRAMGIRSLPVQLGVRRAAQLACATMALPQLLVSMLLWRWGSSAAAVAVLGLLGAQAYLIRSFLRDPVDRATWYSATGVTLYVSGMMISAFALRGLSLS